MSIAIILVTLKVKSVSSCIPHNVETLRSSFSAKFRRNCELSNKIQHQSEEMKI